ncbi:polysaccharide deacetylase family protein [Sinomonas soli]
MPHNDDGLVSRRAAMAFFTSAAAIGSLAACTPARGGREASTAIDVRAPSAPATAPVVRDFSLPPVQGGLVPVITRVTTKEPVVFLTIDDGITKRPEAIQLLHRYGYPATMFLTKSFVQEDPAYFRQLVREGDFVENHTVSHDTRMSTKPYSYQLAEIQGMQDYAQATFGRRPTLFRPPGGAHSTTMRRACAAAGIRALIDWEAKADAGHMDYQQGRSLRPGDIVLMHFRPEFAADLAAFRTAVLAAGLSVANLERFIGAQ